MVRVDRSVVTALLLLIAAIAIAWTLTKYHIFGNDQSAGVAEQAQRHTDPESLLSDATSPLPIREEVTGEFSTFAFRVVDEADSAPLGGARVWIPLSDVSNGPSAVTTNEDGIARIQTALPLPLTLAATLDGFDEARIQLKEQAHDQIEIRLHRHQDSIDGVVCNAKGEALDGIVIIGWPSDRPAPSVSEVDSKTYPVRALSDAGGRFSLPVASDTPEWTLAAGGNSYAMESNRVGILPGTRELRLECWCVNALIVEYETPDGGLVGIYGEECLDNLSDSVTWRVGGIKRIFGISPSIRLSGWEWTDLEYERGRRTFLALTPEKAERVGPIEVNLKSVGFKPVNRQCWLKPIEGGPATENIRLESDGTKLGSLTIRFQSETTLPLAKCIPGTIHLLDPGHADYVASVRQSTWPDVRLNNIPTGSYLVSFQSMLGGWHAPPAGFQATVAVSTEQNPLVLLKLPPFGSVELSVRKKTGELVQTHRTVSLVAPPSEDGITYYDGQVYVTGVTLIQGIEPGLHTFVLNDARSGEQPELSVTVEVVADRVAQGAFVLD